MVDFGGWSMPLAYAIGTVAEHLACRTDAVAFDVSHLGTVRVAGAGSLDRLQRTLTNDLGKIGRRAERSTPTCSTTTARCSTTSSCGGCDEESFDVMPNASNTDRVRGAIGGDDVTATRAVIAVQGPRAASASRR